MSALFAAFGIDWHLLLIQLVNFALLLTALTYFLYRPVLRIIDERRAKIAEGVRVAGEAEQKLTDAKREGEQLVGDAAKQAEGLVAAARARAGDMGSELMKQAQARSDAMLAEAHQRAEEAKRQAIAESQRDIARAAMMAAEKILRERSA